MGYLEYILLKPVRENANHAFWVVELKDRPSITAVTFGKIGPLCQLSGQALAWMPLRTHTIERSGPCAMAERLQEGAEQER